jgi:hypothetical protein
MKKKAAVKAAKKTTVKRKALIRRIRPQTAFTFLDRTLPKFILEEPRRMEMGTWCERGRRGRGSAPCGTVGCVGGWTEILTGHSDAATVLGLRGSQTGELFFNDLMYDADQGTIRHAKRVVQRIRGFAKEHEEQLRAHMIRPRGNRRRH